MTKIKDKIKEIIKLKGNKTGCPKCGHAMRKRKDSNGEWFYDCYCGNTESSASHLVKVNVSDREKVKQMQSLIAESSREYGAELLEQVEADLRRLIREHDGLKSSDRLVFGNIVIESIAGFRLKIKKENDINP